MQQLKASYDQVTANVEGLTSQLAFHTKRLSAISTENRGRSYTRYFDSEDTQNQVDATKAQLLAGQAAQLNARLALDLEIDGVHTTVAQLQARIHDAKWNLLQTTVRAPADGYVTTIGLSVGDRALGEDSSVLSFIVADQVKIVGMFAPNGFRAIKPGTAVKLVFDEVPGRIYHATVATVPRGVGQGQIAASGALARVGSVEGVDTYPAVISVPQEIDPGVSTDRHARESATAIAEQGGRDWNGRLDPAMGQSLHRLPMNGPMSERGAPMKARYHR